jgi:SAM-dependent methyltransferase
MIIFYQACLRNKMNTELNLSKLHSLLTDPRFSRASGYDPQWIIDNQMGLNALWLTEWLCQVAPPSTGMRVLDLGCGKALSSIFLAKEYGVQVWAADLWIKPTENYTRIAQAGVEGQVIPIYADARSLPFAEGYFDALLCTDAFIYFGTDDLYLDYVLRFLKPGGVIGITVPGFIRETDGELPAHLLPFWAQECWSWHTPAWWRRHWERTGLVEIITAEALPEGWELWLRWKLARQAAGDSSPGLESDIRVLQADQGEFMGFIRLAAKKRA